MRYGQYYIDDMPVGDETNDTYCVIYSQDPNEEPSSEVGNFTITEKEERARGSLDAAMNAYMRYWKRHSPAGGFTDI